MSSLTEPPTESLSIAEMVRVLDVASEVRRKQALLDRQWNAEAARLELRERLLETQATTGESLTTEQVDAAIDWYYDRLHRFQEPRKSIGYYLAHIYIRRRTLFLRAMIVAVALAVCWAVASFVFAQPHHSSSDHPLGTTAESIEADLAAIESVNVAPDRRVRIDRWRAELARSGYSPGLAAEVNEMRSCLESQYGIVILDWFPELSDQVVAEAPYPGTTGMPDGRFVLMGLEGGNVTEVPVTDFRDGERRSVRQWYQAVPEDVRRRNAQRESFYYAYKYPGLVDIDVVLEDIAGNPVPVGLQMPVGKPAAQFVTGRKRGSR